MAKFEAGYFGARFSIYPMTDRYVPVIQDAIDGIPALASSGLEVETDDVSTFIKGDRNAVWATLEGAFAKAARSGEHVVMTVLVSHGCPGEELCEIDPRTGTADAAQPHPGAGVPVSCQWSLYPLGEPGYMDVIYTAIADTKDAGVFATGRHFVSHLNGDLDRVLGSIRRAFDVSCESAAHVAAHITLSANSPTGKAS
ncbi:MAG: Ykof family thiamine-binding protein [Chloroflexota bacterium]|nr:Ykof family thiamine-binding protein [Chloroflexota bacterium]